MCFDETARARGAQKPHAFIGVGLLSWGDSLWSDGVIQAKPGPAAAFGRLEPFFQAGRPWLPLLF